MTLKPSDLHVFTARSNPLHWRAPHENWKHFAKGMLDAGVTLTVIECAYGEEDHRCAIDGARHIPVRAKSRVWNKENLLNIGVHRTPEAKYVAWIDADVIFRRADWVIATLHALQHYEVVQPWKTCYDLGPNGEHMSVNTSFAYQFFTRRPLVPAYPDTPFWQGDGGPHVYPHSGYAWAMTRAAFDGVGGLFELGGMGSGDHHMALALVNRVIDSSAPGASTAYNEELFRWQRRAWEAIKSNLGYVSGTIEHLFHGRKGDRGYQSRWGMFLKHGFDPHEDLKRNSHGVLEWAGNKPELRHDFDLYLQSRNEDINAL
jgi:hypothetical protein